MPNPEVERYKMLSCGNALVDLSEPVYSGLPVSSREVPVVIEPRMTHQKDGFAASTIRMGSHAGTHIDAPFHFRPEGATVDQLALGSLIGAGLILDLRVTAGLCISRAEIEAAISESGGWVPGAAVLLWTGWDEHFGGPDMAGHPYLSAGAAAYLVEVGAVLVAIDATGVDDSMAREFPAHEALLGAGIPVVENVRGLGQLGAGQVSCAFIPLAIRGGDAAPVRAFAWRILTK
jgi:arylformamidase